MTTDNLGRIQRVGLRQYWEHEARDFTPWLASNIEMLGEAVGISLEMTEQESAVGSRSLDIFAIDRSDGRPVIIENQLEITDNDHLSRLLIYAAGKDAKSVIWVAREIDDEHRQVLDWLNQRTDENTQFFGVVIELWQIDQSRPAPYFRVAVAPNGWRKLNLPGRRTPSVGIRQRNFAFRKQLADRLQQEHNFRVSDSLTGNNSWCVLGSVEAIGHYSTDFPRDHIRVNLVIGSSSQRTPGWNQQRMARLKQYQSHIELSLIEEDWEELRWVPSGSAQRSFVSVFRRDNIHNGESFWPEYQNWIIKKFFRLRETLAPYLETLNEPEVEESSAAE